MGTAETKAAAHEQLGVSAVQTGNPRKLPAGKYGATCACCVGPDGKEARVTITIDENGELRAVCENHGSIWGLMSVVPFGEARRMHEERFAPGTLQERVVRFGLRCFGEQRLKDISERNERFLEEALELVQAAGATAERAHALVDYVFGRPAGDVDREVGGVQLTLMALCNAHGLNAETEGELELNRVYERIPEIREKNVNKAIAIAAAAKARNVFTPDGETRVAGAHETGTSRTREGRPYGACPAPVVIRPARSLSLRFTHDTCGDRVFVRLVQQAAEEFFALDRAGTVWDYSASNGVHVQVFVHEHIGETTAEVEGRRHHAAIQRMRDTPTAAGPVDPVFAAMSAVAANGVNTNKPYMIVAYGSSDLPEAYFCTTIADVERALCMSIFGEPSPPPGAAREMREHIDSFFDEERWSRGQWEGVTFEDGGIAAYRVHSLDRGHLNATA